MLEEDISQEVDVMRSIYGEDFTPLKAVWGYPSFAVICKPVLIQASRNLKPASVTISFVLPKVKLLYEIVQCFIFLSRVDFYISNFSGISEVCSNH